MLTAEERNRFASYLEEEAKNVDSLAKHCENIHHYPMATKLRFEAACERVIAARLRLIHEG